MRRTILWLLLCAALAAHAGDILLLKGFQYQPFLPAGLLSCWPDLTVRDAFLARLQTGYALDKPFPKQLKLLADTRLVVMADIPASALNGLMGRYTLRQYVERGGSLLVFGGPLAYGKGEIAGSMLEDVLPVTTTGPWDLVKAANPVVVPTKASPLTAGIVWSAKLRVAYYQVVTPKPGAQVLLTCDGHPLLVTGRYGKGRIACFMGTILGDATLYTWPGYSQLLGQTINWLLETK